MALMLLRLFFLALGTLASIASQLILRTFAILVVIVIHLLKLPGAAINGLLDGLSDVIRSGVEHAMSLVMGAAWSIVSGGFGLATSTTAGSVSLTGSAVVGLVEKTKSALDDLAEIFPEVFTGTSEMVGRLVLSLWESYKDAVVYIVHRA